MGTHSSKGHGDTKRGATLAIQRLLSTSRVYATPERRSLSQG